MSSTVEQETDDMVLTEVAPVIEGSGVPDDAAKKASVEGVNSQAEAIGARELKAILEAVLFVSPEPVPVARLMSILGTVSKAEVVQALELLTHDLDQDGRGIQLVQVAGGYRLVTKQEYGPWLKRMDKAKAAQKLSRSALESLAIIAYKQPLVRSEIEEIRGVETSGVLRTLCERKLVRIVGRKDVPGRPIMYGTTKFFLEHFGLQDLSQLPPLREFKELGESEQALLPIEVESLVGVETSETSYSEALPVTSDLAEDEAVVAFDAETDDVLLEEPVEQA
ncbi:MAG: SMC-Scp complex subunit ScpB [Nitrospirae bacterium]|nr:SMC-Scp complex subunit ScpB [Nitrospirota bacterium]MDE3050159.1 SMC-Scp complex subunit ScpB [Nitrospirota bacterium]